MLLYNTLVSEYIKTKKAARHMSYEAISDKADVPLSTLHAYAKGTTATPNEEYLIRIAAVFGDGPDVIRRMREASAESMDREKRLMGAATDQELMAQFSSLMRSNMLAVLDEYKARTTAEQAQRIETVKSQYEAHIKTIEERCQREMDMREKFFERLLAAECENAAKMQAHYTSSKEYLKTVINNLSIALGISATLALAFVLYSVFAYRTFDVNDLTQGLAQHDHTAAPFVLILVLVCVLVFFGGKFVFARKMLGDDHIKNKE